MVIDDIRKLQAYEIISEQCLESLKSNGVLLKHKKTGAKISLIINDDENKVFYIGFRTPPKDSTGMQHIMEHSVLCGSKKYPAKDPFVELAKGSLNTFLNAMTYTDKTVYPVASCNDKDFQNLMNVYLDAVFYPNIHSKEVIFKQEGWHYEIEDAKSPVTINGVVYNEMKGVFSSAEDVLDRKILNELFPDSVYSNESGGDPKVIPTLKYEDFLEYHNTYYHPSNSYIFLYGNMDMAEKLDFIDKEYLSDFSAIDIDTNIALQKGFEEIKEVTDEYSITTGEEETDNTYLSCAFVTDTILNREYYIAFQILEYALISSPGAVLKQTLLDRGIGKDVDGGYDNSTLQPYFSIVAKNANPCDYTKFKDTVYEVLTDCVKNGLDKKTLQAGLNSLEFRYRESDFGGIPKGLVLGLQSLDSWLYDENLPYIHLEINDIFAFLKEKITTDYFEELIQKFFIDNKHCAFVTLLPKQGLTTKNDKELEEKLKKFKESLSKEQIQALIDDTKALKKYQEEPSTKEELETIPLLSISDIKKTTTPLTYELDNIADIPVITHDIFTNGIGYLVIGFEANNIPNEMLPYVALLCDVLGFVDTKYHSYSDLNNEININSGGINLYATNYPNVNNPSKYKFSVEFRCKVLYDKLDFAFDIVDEIINTSNIRDCKKIKERIMRRHSRQISSFGSMGHLIAVIRSLSRVSPSAAVSEITDGIENYHFLKDLLEDIDSKLNDISDKLTECMHLIFRKDNLFIDYNAEKKEYDRLKKNILKFKDKLFDDECERFCLDVSSDAKNEGLKSSGQVQYVALTGNFRNYGLTYNGALRVLKGILGYDYLWNNIRVKGGAYGCMSRFSRNGDMYLVSYRDPNLRNTLDVYKNAIDYIANFNPSERDMTKYIIGAISELDVPLTPSTRGSRSFRVIRSCGTYEEMQRERDEILACTKESIRALAVYLQKLVEANCICVVGAEDAIEKDNDLFDVTMNLL